MTNPRIILGIESSCDETAIALVGTDGHIHAQALVSQEDHVPYGGVVPEIAARQHSLHMEPLLRQALDQADMTLTDVDAIAVTTGPGLIGGVIVGVMTAKALAVILRLPFYAINHLEGHALSVRLVEPVEFPYLLFLMSGGHCQILIVHGVGEYTLLGETIDDAIGEAFDKSAKMMGLGYPGGVAIETIAKRGNPHRYPFPQPLARRASCDMSFSGLKTAVRTCLLELQETHGQVNDMHKADVAASLQHTIAQIVTDKLTRALKECNHRNIAPCAVVVAGGVAANQTIRQYIQHVCDNYKLPFVAPPLALCTDNAAMIAWAAAERMLAGKPDNPLTTEPRARWPLIQK